MSVPWEDPHPVHVVSRCSTYSLGNTDSDWRVVVEQDVGVERLVVILDSGSNKVGIVLASGEGVLVDKGEHDATAVRDTRARR